MDRRAQTRRFLISHAAQYPLLQIEDVCKALYQSAFGCEHLIDDPSTAADYIRHEAAACKPHRGAAVEPLDGPYCRVHLDLLKEGLSPATFARLFALSARQDACGKTLLKEKLSVLSELTAEGALPFSAPELAEKLENWKLTGYSPCRHSEAFRAAYAPAYRLMKKDYAQFLPLFQRIDRLLAEQDRVILAIDGNSAAGKSTLAALLEQVYGCRVFHMDDFFLRPEQRTPERYAEPGGNVDRERFLSEVLEPLSAGSMVSYRRFDCQTFTLQPPVSIRPGQLNVVEGSYSMHPALAARYTLSVFLRIAPELQRARIITRSGSEMAERFFSLWVPLEQTYFDTFRTAEHCDLVFDIGE